MVGRIASWKGQHVFLAAFAEAFPDGGAEAVIVGSALFGEEAYEKELGRLVNDLGIVSGVRFSGFSDDVWEELSKLDVLVHASTVPEPFGQVVLEGMAAGLPVVAARAGGPAELITDGIDGLLFTPGQSDELATTLRVLAEDPLRRQKLGQNARQRATSMTAEGSAAAVLELYGRVLGRGLS
jgi:glycosyltransferase involved in cell wall biosynthesis